MSIWFNPSLTIEDMRSFAVNTMNEYIGIELTELGEDWLKATMPVDNRTRQAYGILHGGASVTLAETIGSIASAMIVDPQIYFVVGLEINANHIRSAKDGFVTGIARPIHIGGMTHVWDIRLTDGNGKLTCISRLTVAVLKRN
ncbi:MAG: hotdog fold thioesterase [Chitinophagales bacterium]